MAISTKLPGPLSPPTTGPDAAPPLAKTKAVGISTEPALPPGPFAARVKAMAEPTREDFAVRFRAALLKTAEMMVEVPLVQDPSAKVVLLNPGTLKKLGYSAGEETGLYDAALTERLQGTFGLRPPQPGEQPTHLALASHYHDFRGGSAPGAVRGDGRVGAVADAPIVDAVTGRLVGVADIQVKGFPTGLRPVGEESTDWHGHGLERLVVGVMDSIYANYLANNGMRTNEFVALLSTDKVVPENVWGHNNAGLMVRSGSFLRLAHFQYFRNDPEALRELFDHTNDQLCLRLGRKQRLSMPALAAQLIELKATNLADQYWNRVYHGSVTFDNTGILESIDHGTMGVVDRAHPQNLGTSDGFTKEPSYVLSELYEEVLMDLMYMAARGPERQALVHLKPHRFIEKIFERRMVSHALEHLGFDENEGRNIQRREPEAARSFLRVLREIGETPEPGHPYLYGPDFSGRTEPARYDMFQALSVLVELLSSEISPAAQEQRLARALEPLIPSQMEEAKVLARRLLDAAAPLVRAAYQHRPPTERAARLGATVDQARRINQRVDELERNNVFAIARSFVDRIDDPTKLEQARAELAELERRVQRRGPGSPLDVANRLRQRRLRPDQDGVLELRNQVENGVALVEKSTGLRDWVEVQVRGNPLKLEQLQSYRLEILGQDGEWTPLPPPLVRGQQAVFELPSVPPQLTLRVRSDAGALWDNGGHGFARGWAPLATTGVVDDALVDFARRQGKVREPRAVLAPKLVGDKLPRRWLDDYFADESIALAQMGGLWPGADSLDRNVQLGWGARQAVIPLRDDLRSKVLAQVSNHGKNRERLAQYYGDVVLRQSQLGIPALVPANRDRDVHVAWARSCPLEQLKSELTNRLGLVFDAFEAQR